VSNDTLYKNVAHFKNHEQGKVAHFAGVMLAQMTKNIVDSWAEL
jgi:hypothetical protein